MTRHALRRQRRLARVSHVLYFRSLSSPTSAEPGSGMLPMYHIYQPSAQPLRHTLQPSAQPLRHTLRPAAPPPFRLPIFLSHSSLSDVGFTPGSQAGGAVIIIMRRCVRVWSVGIKSEVCKGLKKAEGGAPLVQGCRSEAMPRIWGGDHHSSLKKFSAAVCLT